VCLLRSYGGLSPDCDWVRGQERGRRGQHLLGSLLGGILAAAGNDQALHVVSGELHRVPDRFTGAFRSADRRTGRVSRRVLRRWFCAMVVSGRVERLLGLGKVIIASVVPRLGSG
jgi:hypothetical protein